MSASARREGPAFRAGSLQLRYGGDGQLIGANACGRAVWLFWMDEELVDADAHDNAERMQVTWIREPASSGCISRLSHSDGGGDLLAADTAGSVLLENRASAPPASNAYAPYGYTSPRPSSAVDLIGTADTIPHLAFNGEPLFPAGGCYLPGAGVHRPYQPALGIFLAPDLLSPFAEGGLNCYAYCAGDPINRTDPSGQFWRWIVAGIGLVTAVASLGALAAPAVAASTALTASAAIGAVSGVLGSAAEFGSLALEAAGDDRAASILGWVGLGLTAISSAAAAPAAAKSASKAATGFRRLYAAKRGTGAQASLKTANPQGGGHWNGWLRLNDGSEPVPMPMGKITETYRPGRQSTPKPLKVRDYDDLSKPARKTIHRIRDGGPFPYRQDGTIFGNHEKLLPVKPRGQYREYTVQRRGVMHRGKRRIVTGGQVRSPDDWYYTKNHYKSFYRIRFT